jgi:hypothetical protein
LIILYATHSGFVAIVPLYVIVKLVPGVRAVTAKPPTKVASVLLQVVAAIVKLSSGVRTISEVAVTAVVLTTRATLVTPVGIATAPAGAAAHTAGEAELVQFVALA